jgi:serine phosphatase RsbU (regulator of sigma subunit)/PAS domain-containing protein
MGRGEHPLVRALGGAAAPLQMTRKLTTAWLVVAIAAEVAFALINGLSGAGSVPTSVYLLPPLALALVAPPRLVALVATIAVVLTFLSGNWNDNFGSFDHILRILIAGIVFALAVLSARAMTALSQSRREAIAARGRAEAVGRRLDAILGALAEAVTVHDDDGHTVYANEAAVDLLEAESVDEILRAQPGELAKRFIITREDGSPVAVSDLPGRRAVADLSAEPLLTRSVSRATGEVRWLLTKASMIVDEDGRKMAVNIIEDVTEEKEAELRQSFLASADRALASSLEYEETLEKIAWLAVPTVSDWCAIDIVDTDGERERVALAHRDADKLELGRTLEREYPEDQQEGGIATVLRTGQEAIYFELTDEMLEGGARDARHLELIREIGMRSVMLLPMRSGDQTIGTITLVQGDSERVFDETDLAFARDLASRAAVAVQNARLYQRLTETAHTLQQSLLPERLPQPPGWRVAASYHPAEEESEVGGDFYDVFPVDDGWMVVLGDVTGKGVQAAARTALVRHTARTAARFDPSPAAIMELANTVLREQPKLSIVTMVVARLRIEPDGGAHVIVTAAGHPLPLRIGDSGEATEIGRHDVVLGAFDSGYWTETEARLEPGETLLFYTDGVTDMPGANDRFGDERLRATLAAGPAAAEGVVERVDAALAAFQEGERSDDRALLAVQLVGSGVPAGAGRAETTV